MTQFNAIVRKTFDIAFCIIYFWIMCWFITFISTYWKLCIEISYILKTLGISMAANYRIIRDDRKIFLHQKKKKRNRDILLYAFPDSYNYYIYNVLLAYNTSFHV